LQNLLRADRQLCKTSSGSSVAYTTPRGAILDAEARDGLAHVIVDPALVAIVNPEVWLQEGLEAAKTVAYGEPVLSGQGVVELTRGYETAARNVARARAALAGHRLAKLLNEAFR
jgi:hypothetical protein